MSAKVFFPEFSPFAIDRIAQPSIPTGIPTTAMDHIINVRDNAIAGANMRISVDQARIESVLGMLDGIRMAADMELSGNQADVIAEADAALTDLLAKWESDGFFKTFFDKYGKLDREAVFRHWNPRVLQALDERRVDEPFEELQPQKTDKGGR